MKRSAIKQLMVVAACLILLFIPLTPTYAQQPITVQINGIAIHFTDIQPAIVNGRTLVPMRGVFEHMGFTVDWNDHTSTAILTRQEMLITVRIGDAFITVNGRTQFPEVPPQIVSSRFMLPLRTIAEVSGANVVWNAETRTVLITDLATAAGQVTVSDPTLPQSTPRSNIVLPNRLLSGTELNSWITEYNDMDGPTATELEIIRLVNIERAVINAPALRADPYLMKAARFKSQEMVDLNYFEPTSPVYGRFSGIPGLFNAQISAQNLSNLRGATPQQLVNNWMASANHRNNILNTRFNYIGVGIVDGITTQMFAIDAAQTPTPTPTPSPTPRPALSPTLRIGRQAGTVIEGIPGSITFPLTTRNLSGEAYPAVLLSLDRSNGISLADDEIRISINAGTLELETTALTQAGSWDFELHLNVGADSEGRNMWLSENFTVTIDEAPQPTITLGPQIGSRVRGEPGTVQFTVRTQNIPNGTYDAVLVFNARDVEGIRMAPSNAINIHNNVGLLTLEIDFGIHYGRWWPILALDIGEDARGRTIWVASEEFELNLLQ